MCFYVSKSLFSSGDHRLVKCVDNKKLHNLINVVVLPSFNCKVSLVAKCSGGDLDREHYSVKDFFHQTFFQLITIVTLV